MKGLENVYFFQFLTFPSYNFMLEPILNSTKVTCFYDIKTLKNNTLTGMNCLKVKDTEGFADSNSIYFMLEL